MVPQAHDERKDVKIRVQTRRFVGCDKFKRRKEILVLSSETISEHPGGASFLSWLGVTGEQNHIKMVSLCLHQATDIDLDLSSAYLPEHVLRLMNAFQIAIT